MPIHVRLGVNGIADSWWPLGRFSFNDEGFGAVEDSYEFVTTLTSIEPHVLKAVVADAFNGLAAVYGIARQTFEQMEEAAR
jgi:hypothetical protein